MPQTITLNHRELIMLNIRLIKVAGVTDAIELWVRHCILSANFALISGDRASGLKALVQALEAAPSAQINALPRTISGWMPQLFRY
jgi:hypothetical protein